MPRDLDRRARGKGEQVTPKQLRDAMPNRQLVYCEKGSAWLTLYPVDDGFVGHIVGYDCTLTGDWRAGKWEAGNVAWRCWVDA